MLAALLPVVAGIANAIVYQDAPRASLLESLERAFREGPVGQLESLHVPLYAFYQENFPLLLAIALLNAVGLLATGAVLTFLGKATRARRPQFPSYAVYLPLAAGALFAVAGLVSVVATNAAVSSLLDGPRTVSAVTDWQSGLINASRILEGFARLLLGLGFVLVCLNAMRTGLLTRFMGVLGIIAGALLILPIGGPLPIVQAFWFIGLAISISERWLGAVPPAWRTGRAEPWPSQQQLREMREEEKARERDTASGKKENPATAGRARAGSRRRKRKGRG